MQSAWAKRACRWIRSLTRFWKVPRRKKLSRAIQRYSLAMCMLWLVITCIIALKLKRTWRVVANKPVKSVDKTSSAFRRKASEHGFWRGGSRNDYETMLHFLADENFDNNILRGLLMRNSELNIVRVQDVGLFSADDPIILDWAAQQGRILLTHDVATVTHYAYERVRKGQSMPGVFEVGRKVSVGVAIEEILLLAELSLDEEWEGQVRYLPLR